MNELRPLTFTYEQGCEETLQILRHVPARGNAAVLVGGFFGLNAVSIRRSHSRNYPRSIEKIFVVELSSRTILFWQSMSDIIKTSANPPEVQAKIKPLILDKSLSKPDFDFADCEWKSLKEEIQEGKSWLSDQQRFNRIKAIFDRGDFTLLRLDLFNPAAMQQLSENLKEKEIIVDLLYLSDIGETAKEKQSTSYQKAKELLSNEQTCVIEAHSPKDYEHPVQKIFRNNVPLSLKDVAPTFTKRASRWIYKKRSPLKQLMTVTACIAALCLLILIKP